MTTDCMEGLYTQLRESEFSRWQLHDQCARLERLVNVLRKKVNGLNVLEPGGRADSTKVTLVDMTLHGAPTEGPLGPGHSNPVTLTSSEGEPKDSLSSLESVETASASSWKRGDLPGNNVSHSQSNLHSSYVLLHTADSSQPTLATSHNNPTSSTPAKSNPLQSVPNSSNHSSLSQSSGPTPSSSPHHQQRSNGVSEAEPRHIPGVTIVGPITEL